MALGRAAKGMSFPANTHGCVPANTVVEKQTLQPGFSLGFTQVSQNEVGKLSVIKPSLQPSVHILQPKHKLHYIKWR